MNTRNRFLAAVGAAMLVALVCMLGSTRQPVDNEEKREAQFKRRFDEEMAAAQRSSVGHSVSAVAVPANGFALVLHADGRASIVDSSGIVRPVVDEYTPGISPFTKPMQNGTTSAGKTWFRAYNFRLSALEPDESLDVGIASTITSEELHERAKARDAAREKDKP